LKNYKQEHGRFTTDKSTPLGQRIKSQRRLKRKFDCGGPAGGMCSERVLKLSALGFVWNPPQQGNRK
jgi:hypothetical protein